MLISTIGAETSCSKRASPLAGAFHVGTCCTYNGSFLGLFIKITIESTLLKRTAERINCVSSVDLLFFGTEKCVPGHIS